MARNAIETNISYDDERKTYYVTLNWGKNSEGKYEKTTVTTGNKREARKILAEHKKKMAAGTAMPPVKETLSSAVETYIEYKALKLAATTVYGYRNILKNHIKPYFKEKKIQSVSVQDIQNYIVAKLQGGLSMSSVKKHLELLRSVFADAYRKQLIPFNPFDRLERVTKSAKRKKCLNAAEIATLCESVKDTQLELPVTLAAYLGLRRGEVLGLRWCDIDFDKNILRVENTRTKAGGEVIEKEPKTEKSKRVLVMPMQVVAALHRAKERQTEIRQKHKNYHDSDYVFTRHDGTPFKPNYLSDCFHEHLKKLGIEEIRFHDLRHSFASIANQAGIPITEISSAMGHSSPSVTYSVYTHEFTKEKEEAVNAVAMQIARAQMAAQD